MITNQITEAIDNHIENGHQLIPLRKFAKFDSNSKSPAVDDWPNRTFTAEQLHEYASSGHSIGWVLGPTDLVIDVDVATEQRPGKVGKDSLYALETILGVDFDNTKQVKTQSGGLHIYMQKPADVQIRKHHPDFPDLEFLSQGQQVVIAGCKHWQGGSYTATEKPMCTTHAELIELIKRPEHLTDGHHNESRITSTKLKELLGHLDAELYAHNDLWFPLLAASHHATGGDENALAVFIEWSTSDAGYAGCDGAIAKRWKSLDSGQPSKPITLGTLLKELDEHGHADVAAELSAELDFADVDVSQNQKLASDKIRSGVTPEIRSASHLDQLTPPNMAKPVLDGLLRKGETCNLVAGSKVGKSWLTVDLALTVANGGNWLGKFKATNGKVLILDNELRPATLENRLLRVAKGKKMHLPENLNYDCLRGRIVDLNKMRHYFSAIKEEKFDLIILDAFYRFLPKGISENDNAAVTQLYNTLDKWALQLDCAFVLVHHSSKGDQSGKSAIDVGSGAGSMGRATDTHLAIRPHQQEGLSVLEGCVRSFPPFAPISIKFDFPCWSPVDAEPVLGTTQSKQQAQRDSDGKAQLIELLKGNEPMSARQLRDLTGMGQSRLQKLLFQLDADGTLKTHSIVKRGGNDVQLLSI